MMDWMTEGMNPQAVFRTDRHVLEQRKVGATVRQSMEVQVHEDELRNQLEHRLSAYVLADHIADDVFTGTTTSEWPETTWQMFKSRHESSWWLGWLVRRRPVRMHTERQTVEIQVSRYLNYPEATLRIESLGRPVIFEQPTQISPPRW
jgi:hypothetical protein